MNIIDFQFHKFLFTTFSEKTAKSIYCFVIEVIVFFMKIVVYLYLPFKFFQFFKEDWRK